MIIEATISEGNAAIREVVVSFFLLFVRCAAVLIAVVGVRFCSVLFCFVYFGFFFWFGFLTQNPNLSQGLRVEYLHNLSTRIVVVGWEVELLFMRSVVWRCFRCFVREKFSLKGLLLLFSLLSLSLFDFAAGFFLREENGASLQWHGALKFVCLEYPSWDPFL